LEEGILVRCPFVASAKETFEKDFKNEFGSPTYLLSGVRIE